eukprot:10283958-Prorocentrum_lima.AAC.1
MSPAHRIALMSLTFTAVSYPKMLSIMEACDVLHACETYHQLVMMRRQLGMVGMEVSSSNIWVTAPPRA